MYYDNTPSTLPPKKKNKKRLADVPREGCHANREGLTKITYELRPEGREGLSQADGWEKSVIAEGKACAKALQHDEGNVGRPTFLGQSEQMGYE